MKFLITINVPEAIKNKPVPKEMESMFLEIARYYKEKADKEEAIKDSAIGIHDGNPELSIRVESIKVQGEI